MRTYGSSNYPEDKNRCVESVRDGYYEPRQCGRRRGHGANGEYCRQHAAAIAADEAVEAASLKWADDRENNEGCRW